MTLSTKPSNARTRAVLAAKALFSTQGIRATGEDSIVKSANTNKMSLCKHFSLKDALIVAYLQNSDSVFRSWLVEQIERKAQTPKDKLFVIFDTHAGGLVSSDFKGCLLIKASVEFPDQSHAAHEVSAAFYRKFRSYITDLAGQARARFPERLDGQFCALFQGAIVCEELQRESGPADGIRLAAVLLINNRIG